MIKKAIGIIIGIIVIVSTVCVVYFKSKSVEIVKKTAPVSIRSADVSGLHYVELSSRAAERLDIQTVDVVDKYLVEKKVNRQVVPYQALIYDLDGNTWIYTNPTSTIYLRQHIEVDYIDDDFVILLEEIPSETSVVTVGVAELFGSEFGVGGGH